MGKLHMNNLLVACGINVDPYKLDLKTAHHTPIVYKSLATLKNHVSVVHRPPHRIAPCTCPRESSWGPYNVCSHQAPSLGSASPSWTSLRAGHSWSGERTEDEW